MINWPVDQFENAREKRTCLERWKNCLRVLRALTPHERKNHFEMSKWGEKNDCGTVGCAAGHCGLDPWFRRRGLKMAFDALGDGYFVGKYMDAPDDFFIYGASRIFYDDGTYAQVVKRVKNLIKEIRSFSVAT